MFDKLFKAISLAIFPPKCPVCNKVVLRDELCCKNCIKTLTFIKNTTPFIIPFPSENHVLKYTAPFFYAGNLRKTLLKYKYKQKKQYRDFFAHFMKNHADICFGDVKFDIICIVPGKPVKNEQFTPLISLAKTLSQIYNIPSCVDVLYKSKNILKQHNLNYNQRRENVIGAYKVKKTEMINGKNVLILDDVVTTGSTLAQCGRELYSSGAKNVFGLCIAKTSLNVK